ncbi:MAG: hypothetical protein EA379_06690 [Phycisphaerales bacterium]|nr:MAG: hypothetical protein EA379_06690 [Phycisphaerales bacterium]
MELSLLLTSGDAHELLRKVETPGYRYAESLANQVADRRFPIARESEILAVVHYLADEKPHAETIANRLPVLARRSICDVAGILIADHDENGRFTLLRGQLTTYLARLDQEPENQLRLPLAPDDHAALLDALRHHVENRCPDEPGPHNEYVSLYPQN